MKIRTTLGALLFWFSTTVTAQSATTGDLLITGVLDGPLSGGVPKLVELYAANDIADLSGYSLSNFNNAGTSATGTVALSGSAVAGQFLYLVSLSTDQAEMDTFFGSAAPSIDYAGPGNAVSINGDDAFRLFDGATTIDSFGVVGTDGTGTGWDYRDGWAYRVSGTGQDGVTFVQGNWSFSGANALDGAGTNAGAAAFPLGSYTASHAVIPLPASLPLFLTVLGSLGILARSRRRAG